LNSDRCIDGCIILDGWLLSREAEVLLYTYVRYGAYIYDKQFILNFLHMVPCCKQIPSCALAINLTYAVVISLARPSITITIPTALITFFR